MGFPVQVCHGDYHDGFFFHAVDKTIGKAG